MVSECFVHIQDLYWLYRLFRAILRGQRARCCTRVYICELCSTNQVAVSCLVPLHALLPSTLLHQVILQSLCLVVNFRVICRVFLICGVFNSD